MPCASPLPCLKLLVSCVATLQLPLGPSLPHFLACFHAINLPFLVLNSARLAAAKEPRPALSSKAGPGNDPLAGHAAKLAAAGKQALD